MNNPGRGQRGGHGGPGQGRGRGDASGRGRGETTGPPRGGPGFGPTQRGGGGGGFTGAGVRGGRGGSPVIFAAGRATPLEPRLQDREQDALIASFRTLSTTESRPIRPGWGKVGVAIKVRANFFPVKYPKNCVLYDYSVKITPTTDINRIRKRLFELLEATDELAPYVQEIAHDGAQRIISRRRLPAPFTITVPFYDEGQDGPRAGSKVYNVEIYEPEELKTADLDRYLAGDSQYINYDSLPIISALNLITSQNAAKNGVRFGKNRYFFLDRPAHLALGLEAWKGFYSSVRPAYKQLMVNVNVCMSAFYAPASKLSDAMLSFNRQSRGAMPAFFSDRVRVTTTHLGYRMRKPIKAIGNTTASKTFFVCEELGGRISVADYFRRKYHITLQHADDLPVVNIGSSKKDNFIPAELCEIEPGQPFKGVLSDKATAEMIKLACNPPYVNATAITEEGLGKLGLRQQAAPMAGFGITIDTEMAVVPARVLPPPTVKYKTGQPKVADGSWNILDVTFQVGARLSKWAILVAMDGGPADFRDSTDPALKEIVEGFIAKCKRSGMQVDDGLPPLRFIPKLPPASEKDPFRYGAIQVIEDTLKTLPAAPSLVIVFLSDTERHIYPGLKKLLDVKLGVLSVCMLLPKVRKGDLKKRDQYFSNVALKVNAKLGGTNHLLDESSTRWLNNTMLVGMDVTHPGFDTVKGTPSIAAVVASCDKQFMQYPASLRMQKSREEMIQDVRDMMIERLMTYNNRTKQLPARVIVFRDGVSEGQFDLVIKHELPEIRAAFRHFPSYNPKLTITICGKRHHARFYPTDAKDMDRTGNLRAGMVLDRGVTAVYDFDFYLQAHAGLQGTTRSTHYTVIYDENKLTADDIQQGTNKLCYLWARATKSVSLVPPAYWADIACERGRFYIRELLPPAHGAPERRMNEEQIKRRAEQLWGEGVHARLKDSMFYL